MSIYSTVDYLYEEGDKDGKVRGLLVGKCQQSAKLLARHGKRRFGPPSDEQRALLDQLTDRLGVSQFELMQDRFLAASNWAELLAGATVPGPPPPPPEYLLPYEFDPEPMPPSLDEYMRVTLKAGGGDMVMHMRFQRLYQANLGSILYKENQRLEKQYGCPMQSVVLILWSGADGPEMTGEYRTPNGGVYRYGITRLWETDPEKMYGSIGTAMLAPLARFPDAELPNIMARVKEAIATHSKEEKDAIDAWGVTYCSMGLRYPAELVNNLLADVMPIIHQCEGTKKALSNGYYRGQSKGETEGALQAAERWIFGLGSQRLGEPPASVRVAITAIRDVQRLDQVATRILRVEAWPDALTLN